MNQPKPVQIRLPFTVPRPKKGQEPTQRVCGICRLKDSRYTCPRCNVAYCSLGCFRSEKHNQCSEGFYRETLMADIKADPAAGIEEKKGMMEMLRRFEKEQDGERDLMAQLEAEDVASEEDELAGKLAGVDLESIDTNTLFHLLPPEHRTKFLAALKNPDSEETRQLLDLATQDDSDPESDSPLPDELPWWEAPEVPEDEDDDEVVRYAETPALISQEAVAAITPPEGVGLKLAYNALAICLAYIHTLLSSRLPSLSLEYLASQRVHAVELKTDISTLVPFLVDQKSTIRYTSTREAYSTIWETIGTSSDQPPPPELLVRLLSPLATLLHPPLDTNSSPRMLHLLSDLYRLYSEPKAGAAAKKLAFYIVALRGLGRADWLRLEREVQAEIGRLEGELGDAEGEEKVEERKRLLI